MKKIFYIICILGISISANAQVNFLGPLNSATTQSKMDFAKSNIDNAYASYEESLEKFKYYIDQSQSQGYKSGDFYFLLGVFMYRTQEFKAAKRYWKISFKEGGCWDCKELLEKLEKNEDLNSLIAQKISDYNLKSKM